MIEAYLLCGANGSIMEEIKTYGLPLGQVVSYGDMANLRHEAVVISAEGGAHGQPCIFVDTLSQTEVSITVIEGPGGWHLEKRIAQQGEIDLLKREHEDRQAQLLRTREEERARNAELLARGEVLLDSWLPEWAKTVIVAEQQVDESDIMTDYFHSTVARTVLLAPSRHLRRLFPEMRKAAWNLPETQHLVTAPESAEHREDYSMGAGLYLKDGYRHSNGWAVRKLPLAWGRETLAMALATAEGTP